MNILKWKERKGWKEAEREKGDERKRDEESMRERDRWGSDLVRERGRLLKREREREKDEESLRRGKETKSP